MFKIGDKVKVVLFSRQYNNMKGEIINITMQCGIFIKFKDGRVQSFSPDNVEKLD